MKIRKLGEKGFAHIIVPMAVVSMAAIIGTYIVVTSHAATCSQYEFGYGSSGQCVRDIQNLVNYDLHGGESSKFIAVDGSFGANTRAAVESLQAQRGLGVDGIVGPQTWPQVCNAEKGPAPLWWSGAYTNAGCP